MDMKTHHVFMSELNGNNPDMENASVITFSMSGSRGFLGNTQT